MIVTFDHQTGPTRFFDTEMLQLELTVGGCVMIQKSPTKASTGKTAITDVGGGFFRIDSFFDIFKELSKDCGGPGSSPPMPPVNPMQAT